MSLQRLQISKWAPLSWFEGAGAVINFFSFEEGCSLKGGVHLGRDAISDKYGTPFA